MISHVYVEDKQGIDGFRILYTQLAHGESSFVDTGGLCSRAKHIVDVGDVIWRSYPFGLLKETNKQQCISRSPFSDKTGIECASARVRAGMLTMAQSPSGRIHFDARVRSMYTGHSIGR